MSKFRLKKEALQFFPKTYHKEIKSLNFWKGANIHKNLLEEVEAIHISYGIKENETSISLSEWSGAENTAKFRFTMNIQGVDFKTYEAIDIRLLMDQFQYSLNVHIGNIEAEK